MRSRLGDPECAVWREATASQLPLKALLHVPRTAGECYLCRVVVTGLSEPPWGRQRDLRHVRSERHARHPSHAEGELVASRCTGRRHERALVHQIQLRLICEFLDDGPHANLVGLEPVMLGDAFELHLFVELILWHNFTVDHLLNSQLHLVIVNPTGMRRFFVLIERIIVRNF